MTTDLQQITTAADVETVLNNIHDSIDQTLRSGTNNQKVELARLHRTEADAWKRYADLSRDRLRRLAALRAADRSSRLSAELAAPLLHQLTSSQPTSTRPVPSSIQNPFLQAA